jgi:V/A-type H+-transporting ATPase subunit E
MSGAEKLKEKILAEAGNQVEQVLADAREKAAKILAKGEAETAAKQKSVLDFARVQADERRRRAQTIAELDSRKAILAAKEELIEETFQQALNRLSVLDAKSYEDLIYPMLLAASQTGAEEVIVSALDRRLFTPEFMDRVNKALLSQGKPGALKLSGDTHDMQGGFILRTGSVEINSTFSSILRMQRDQLEPEVAAILFG